MKIGDSYDVVVMGGGPAGATSATLLAEAGRRVLVVERRDVGDFKIGESLMPATCFRELRGYALRYLSGLTRLVVERRANRALRTTTSRGFRSYVRVADVARDEHAIT